MRRWYTFGFAIPAASLAFLMPCVAQESLRDRVSQDRTSGHAELWTDPGDIRARNLYWGPGGQQHEPQPPTEFIAEDMAGTSPKFDVRDSAGKKWKAKLGLEAQPETVASRLLWAVGYTANFNYFFPHLRVDHLPPVLHRGQDMIGRAGDVPNVRLQRHPDDDKKTGNWNWRHNPFAGSRELNGLRVMMGLIGNWDLKDDNNAIFENQDSGPKLYAVSDVGTAFGTSGKSYSDKASKGKLSAYRREKLLSHVHKNYVDLNFPRLPVANVFEFRWTFVLHQLRIRWIGKRIPRADAKWIGSLLAQLSPDQIHDAFAAAGYSPEEIDAYTSALCSRIQELNQL